MVTVRVPASTSNLGPGYDCLGVALRLYNAVTVTRGDAKVSGGFFGTAARAFFNEAGVKPFPFKVEATDRIPQSRGLGSSASVRSGLLLGLNRLAGDPLERDTLFKICAKLEAHPDNAAPALFGGLTVVRGGNVQRFNVSRELIFVLLVPDLRVQTSAARKILPRTIAHGDAVQNSGNACALTAALVSRNYEALRGAFLDRLHQPFREKLVPFLPRVVRAAEKAGALGAFLSGSGSTIAALTVDAPERVARAMLDAAPRNSQIVVTTADNQGARLQNSKTKI